MRGSKMGTWSRLSSGSPTDKEENKSKGVKATAERGLTCMENEYF